MRGTERMPTRWWSRAWWQRAVAAARDGVPTGEATLPPGDWLRSRTSTEPDGSLRTILLAPSPSVAQLCEWLYCPN